MNEKSGKDKGQPGTLTAEGGQADLAVIFDRITDGFVALDKDWRFTYINKKAGELVGRRPEDLIGKHLWTEFAEGRDRPVYEAYQRAMKDQSPIHFEEYSPTWDRWFEYSAYPSPAGLAVFFQDVTDRKRAQEELIKEHDLLSRIAETSPAGIVMVDRRGQITFANSQAEQVLGLSRNEITRRTYNAPAWRITDYEGKTFPEEKLPFSQVMASERPVYGVRHAIEHPDGRRILLSISASPLFDGAGRADGMVATVEDVTAQVWANRLIRNQRDLALALSSARDIRQGLRLCLEAAIRASDMDCGGIYLKDAQTGDLDLVYHKGLSPEFVKSVSHYPADSARAQLVAQGLPLYAEFPIFESPADIAQNKEGLRAIAVLPIRHEGRIIGCLNVSSHPKEQVPELARGALETMAAQIGGCLARLQAEAALQESEAKYRELEKELSVRAADLRNLSSRLLGAQEEERKNISRELHDEMGQALTMVSINFSYLKKALSSTQRAKVKDKIDESDVLIRKLLEQVHELTLDLHPHMLDDLGLLPTVKWFVERFSKNLNLEVRLVEKNWSEPVEAGLALGLFRIIQESLTNAAKHARAKKIRIRLSQSKNTVEARIEDDGCGFDLARVEQDRRKKHGVGFLGMRERAAFLNGKCLFESRPGQGTCVHVILPKR
jgi:PAS domain S-box-containing protein